VSLVPYRFLAFDPPFGSLANYLPLLLTIILAGALILLRRETLLAMLKKDVLLGAIVALVAADLLAAIGGVNSMHSISRSAYYFLTGPLIYWVVGCSFQRAGNTRLLITMISAFSGLAALYGISEYASGGSWLYQSTLSIANPKFAAATGGAEFIGRVLGTLGHPVAFGAFLLLSLPASLYLARSRSRARPLGVCAAGAAVVAIALTFSRGAWISLAVAAAAWVTMRMREHGRSIVWRVMLVSVFLAVGVSLTLSTRETYTAYVQNYDKNPRILAYVYSATLLPEHLVAGSGTGTFRWLGKSLGSRLDAADSMYLTRLIEGGVLGLTTFLYLLARIYNCLATSSRQRGQIRASVLSPLFLAALLGIAVDMMTFDLLSWPATRSWFWIQVAIAVGVAQEQV
jgi:hypothetical protein